MPDQQLTVEVNMCTAISPDLAVQHPRVMSCQDVMSSQILLFLFGPHARSVFLLRKLSEAYLG